LREINFGFTGAIGFGSDTLAYSYGARRGTAVVNPGGGPFRVVPVLLPCDEAAGSQNYQVRLIKTSYQATFTPEPVKHWTIHLIAQSHVDIGYTDYAGKVSEVYNKNFAYANDLARKTSHYSDGSGFRWNAEVLWPVDTYLSQASPEQVKEFREAVKNGWINLDAAYGSINTSLCNGEQLLRLFEYGDSLEKLLDVNLIATQQVDVPGASWGIVEAMSQSGVKFFLNLPNYMDDNYLENRPFFWESPSGKSRILHFQTYYYNLGYHLKGRYIPNYLQGNTDPVYKENPDDYFLDPFIFSFLDQLKEQGYVYRQLPLAWTMTDNAALDPDLPEVVRRWNQKYLNPRVLISSAADFYHDFIRENESKVPVMAGDYTESWTDGVASGSMETRANRSSQEDILRLEALGAITGRGDISPATISAIWKRILLFTEHTWGSYKSSTDFDDPYVFGQWVEKAAHAWSARSSLDSLLGTFSRRDLPKPADAVKVNAVNTLSWAREATIELEGIPMEQIYLTDKENNSIPAQKTGPGRFLFRADRIEPYSSASYRVHPGQAAAGTSLQVEPARIVSRFYSIQRFGNDSLVVFAGDKKKKVFSVDQSFVCLVKGQGSAADTLQGRITGIRAGERGPLRASFTASVELPGTRDFNITLALEEESDQVEVTISLDKQRVMEKEKISFLFGVEIPESRILYEIPWGYADPDRDLLRGSNRKYFTVQRFIDLSNTREGITLIPMDAPIIQLKRNPQSVKTIVESVVIDNGWHTNFPATQSGPMEFRYLVRHHGTFDREKVTRWSIEQFQPVVTLFNTQDPIILPWSHLDLGSALATSFRRDPSDGSYLLRLFNTGTKTTQVRIELLTPYRLYRKSTEHGQEELTGATLELVPLEVVTLSLKSN
ncbi:MAG: hypothetical protein R6V75_07460, partial [Bacteroidales bacterium]